MELRVEQLVREGMSMEEAREEALRRFAPTESARRDLGRAAHRRERSNRFREWLTTVRQDASFAMRSFGRSPGLTGLVVGILALGIGASSTMFTLVNAVLLKPLPYDDPDRWCGSGRATRRGMTVGRRP